MPRHHTISRIIGRIRFLGIVVVVILVLVTLKHTPFISRARILGETTANLNVSDLAAAINLARQSHNVSPLQPDTQLNTVAAAKAQDIIDEQYWAHTPSPAVSPWRFLDASGYQYLYAGENLARNFNSADAVVTAWLNSPGHRDNLLSDHYTQMGLAVVTNTTDPSHSPVIVAIFAEPLPPSQSVANLNPQDRYTTTDLINDSLPIIDVMLLVVLGISLVLLIIRIVVILNRLRHHHFFRPPPRLWRK